MRGIAVACLFVASVAQAQVPPPYGQQPYAQQPYAQQPYAQQPVPQQPYGYAPPPYPPQAAYAIYEAEKKSEATALLLEFLVPGVGSVYADHAQGALVTWGLSIGGILLIVWGITDRIDDPDHDPYHDGRFTQRETWAILAGIGAVLGGRIYGLWDSWDSTKTYNAGLQRRLGIGGMWSLGLAPISGPRATGWGPVVQVKF